MPVPAFVQPLFERQDLRLGVTALAALLAASMVMAQASEVEGATDASARNAAPQNRPHKKTVTFTRFQAANSLQVEDIADIWDGYPLELLRRLEARGNVEARHSAVSPFPDPRNLNPDSPASRELVRHIAGQYGSQFVISGIILDAAVSDESLRPYAGWQGRETGRRFELGLPWNSVAAGVRPVATERRLEVEIFLHDGLTGALIKRYRNNEEISGRVAVGRNKSFASAAFFDTAFGKAADHLMNTQIELIDNDLASPRSDAAARK
ncbi:MAG: hypothetical protein C3F18_04890 [Nitrosomonadales bacterium]|nr:MAG: hypothetical protein C3F18_04890 [Nitrosomonadales bacterium]